MNKFLLIAAFLTSGGAAACPATQHPLYCTILDLQPHADPAWAMGLSNSVARYAKRNAIDPYLLLAIGMQESSLRNVHRLRGQEVTDVGVFQLHVRTIAAHGFDYARLLEDVDYQVASAAWLLAHKQQLCAALPDSFACYHSVTPRLKAQYAEQVMRWYRGMSNT